MSRYVTAVVVVALLVIALATGAVSQPQGAGTPGTPGAPGAPTRHVATFVPSVTATVFVPTFTPTVDFRTVTPGCGEQGNLIACAQSISTIRTIQGVYPTATLTPQTRETLTASPLSGSGDRPVRSGRPIAVRIAFLGEEPVERYPVKHRDLADDDPSGGCRSMRLPSRSAAASTTPNDVAELVRVAQVEGQPSVGTDGEEDQLAVRVCEFVVDHPARLFGREIA